MKLHLSKIIDSIKSGWYVWECETDDGVKGTVEGDYTGDMYAAETFINEDGELLKKGMEHRVFTPTQMHIIKQFEQESNEDIN